MAFISFQGITIFNRFIPFWILSLILLLVIIIQNIKPLKKFFIWGILFIGNTIKILFRKISKFLETLIKKEFWKKLSEKISKENKNHYIAHALIGATALFFAIFIEIIKESYTEIISKTNFNVIFLLFTLFGIIVLLIIFTSITSSKIQFSAIYSVFLIYGVLFYFAFNNHSQIINGLLVFLILLSIIFLCPFILKNQKDFPLWFLGTITLMIIILTIGSGLLYYGYGYKDPSLNLNIDGNVYNKFMNGQNVLHCSIDEYNEFRITPNKAIRCKIDNINNLSDIYIKFVGEDNKEYEYYSNTSIEIINDNSFRLITPNVPTNYLYFESNIISDKNEMFFVSTAHHYKIQTKEKWSSNDKELIKYFLALLTAVFVSIPIMIYNLRKLSICKTGKSFN